MTTILFWGTTGKYGIFSNFYPSSFKDENGVLYNCNEQYFMIQKLLTFDPDNKLLYDKIIQEKNPKNIKQLGRQVKNYYEQTWNKLRYSIMLKGLVFKFSQNPELKQRLLETGNQLLAEASPYDRIWGIGMSASEAKYLDPSQWKGQNLLGKALMEVRTQLS